MTYSPQAPNAVMMVRPRHFIPNPETSEDNAFQFCINGMSQDEIAKRAYDEVTQVAQTLATFGIKVHLFENDTKNTPDAVFPNNWFSTHAGGQVALYPMYAENRRLERNVDVIECLKRHYYVQQIVDYSGLEADGLFLEGTGSMVVDHLSRIVYAAKSYRTNTAVLERFCTQFNYQSILFDARDNKGKAIYHTNVLMCIASDFVMMGLDMLTCHQRKAEIIERISQSGRQLIQLTAAQIGKFCGNALELQGKNGRIIAVSNTAFHALTQQQREQMGKSCQVVSFDVSTIEQAGGSIRCMLAGIHLSPRSP